MSNLYTADRSVSTRAALTMLGLIAVWGSVFGQTLPQQTVPTAPGVSVEEAVNTLVADALAANLELDGASAGVAQQLAALDQARALYLPSLDLAARYTRANGGRTIDFPVGDLLNPVSALGAWAIRNQPKIASAREQFDGICEANGKPPIRRRGTRTGLVQAAPRN